MKIFLVLGLMVAGGIVGLVVSKDPGYVLLRYDGFSIETSLWVVLLTWFLAYGLFGFSIKFAKTLVSFPKDYVAWKRKKQNTVSIKDGEKGVFAIFENRWADATELLLRASRNAENPLSYLLFAAKAAHKAGLGGERDNLLEEISSRFDEAKKTVAYMRVDFHMEENRFRDAAGILGDIRMNEALPDPALEKLLICYKELGDQRKVETLRPELERRALIIKPDKKVGLK